MLRALVRKSIRRCGYEVHRIKDVPPPVHELHPQFRRADLDECLQVIKRFTKSDSDSMTWERSRKYLDPVRASFYHSIADLIESSGCLVEDARVLDIGVYFGYLLRILHERQPKAKYAGTETHETRLQIARELCPFAEIEYGTIDGISRPYELVLLTEVLEHLVDPSAALASLSAISKSIILTVPDGRRDTLGSLQFNSQWGSYRGHVNFWSPESWNYWLAREFPGKRIETGLLPTNKQFAIIYLSSDAASLGL